MNVMNVEAIVHRLHSVLEILPFRFKLGMIPISTWPRRLLADQCVLETCSQSVLGFALENQIRKQRLLPRLLIKLEAEASSFFSALVQRLAARQSNDS